MTDAQHSPQHPTPPDENTIPPHDDPGEGSQVMDPPTGFVGTLKQLGPGLIIAGSIVGSGELIATTKTGAQAGLVLLWLIIIGCVIKVFVQIELGRFAITHGETTLSALNKIPGQVGRVSWILWFWLVMMAASIAQLGGIVGGVGQAMGLSFPLTGDYAAAVRLPASSELGAFLNWDRTLISAVDIAAWKADPESSAAARIAALPKSKQDELLSAFDKAFTANATIDVKQIAVERETLRTILKELNADALAEEVKQRVASDSFEGAATKDRLGRISRGHAILAESFIDYDSQANPHTSLNSTALLDLKRTELRAAADLKAAQKASPTEDHADQEAALSKASNAVAQETEPSTWDDRYWAAVVTLITIALLYNGRYGIIQNISTAMVVLFTFITIGNVVSLQSAEQFAFSANDFVRALSFQLPDTGNGIIMALATFGIIGVGATELITYPYWCIEKGYARYTGWRSEDPQWAERARGWMRIMHWDAFMSMAIYTIATIAFFIMGAAVLFREGRDPDGMRMVSTLATAYVPVFWRVRQNAVSDWSRRRLVLNLSRRQRGTLTHVYRRVQGLRTDGEERSEEAQPFDFDVVCRVAAHLPGDFLERYQPGESGRLRRIHAGDHAPHARLRGSLLSQDRNGSATRPATLVGCAARPLVHRPVDRRPVRCL